MSTSNFVHLLNKFITIACKIVIVVALLLYGLIIFSVRMEGVGAYRNPELRAVYTFDKLDFTLDKVQFVVKDGQLVTVARAGEENELAVFGQGRISWYREPRLKTFTKVLISLNPEDLQEIIAANRENLKKRLKYEVDTFDIQRKTRDFLKDEHTDRLDIFGIHAFYFFRLPPPGEITFDIYSQDEDLGDYMSNYARAGRRRAQWIVVLTRTLFSVLYPAMKLLVLLLIAMILAILLTYAAPALGFAVSMIKRSPPPQWTVMAYSIFSLGLTVLLAGSLVLIFPALSGDTTKDMHGYKVSFSADAIVSIENFTLRGNYSDFSVEKGILVPGTTEVGVTVMVILGDGEWAVREPGQYIWKNVDREMDDTPFKERFTSIYLRIHPRFYQDLLAGATVEKIHDVQDFKQAEKIYKHKFWNSYHSNERAIIPSTDVGTIDIESVTWGRLLIHEEIHFASTTMPPKVTHWDYKGDPPWYMD